MQLGYSAPKNEDCEVRGNVIVNGSLSINKFQQVVKENNLIACKNGPRRCDSEARVVIRPNRYDANCCHVVVFHWTGTPAIRLDGSAFSIQVDRLAGRR